MRTHARLPFIVGLLVVLCALPASLAVQEVDAAATGRTGAEGATFFYNVAYVGNRVVDLEWDEAAYGAPDLGYKITRDEVTLAELGVDTTFYRDSNPLPGTHTYTLHRLKDRGYDPNTYPDTVTLGAVEGLLYQDLTWSGGTYELVASVEVMPGVTLTIDPGVRVTAGGSGFLDAAGELRVDGAVLELLQVYVDGDGSEIRDSEVSSCSLTLNAGATLEGNDVTSSGVRVRQTAQAEMTGNTWLGGTIVTQDQATLTMEDNVFQQGNAETRIQHRSAAPLVLIDNQFEGCAPSVGEGTVLLTGAGAVTVADNAFRCLDSDADDALAVQAYGSANGIIEGNIFEGPSRSPMNMARAIDIGSNAGITLQDNLFYHWPVGLELYQGGATILRNTFYDISWGESIDITGDGEAVLHTNCFVDTGMTIASRTEKVTATLNWWGDATGPSHEDNPEGRGWAIFGDPVVFDPWLTDETDAPCNVVDFSLAGAEVIQSVQSLANDVPLIADKPTIVRLYADSAVGSVSGVPVVVRAYRDGSEIGVRATLADAAPVRDIDAVRDDPEAGAIVRLPQAWLNGTVTLAAEINPGRLPSEVRYDNNVLTRTVSFEARRPLRVAYVPVTYQPEGTEPVGPTAGNVPKLHTAMESLYPIPKVDYEVWSPLRWHLQMRGSDREDPRADLAIGLLTLKLAIVNAGRPEAEQMDQIFGYFPGDSLGFCYSDPPWDGGSGVAAYCATGGMWMAHEVGHNLGLRHPNTPDSAGAEDSDTYWPYSNAQIREVGYHVPAEALKPSTCLDFMTYAEASKQWTSPLHYGMLFSALPAPSPSTASAQAAGATTYLLISGQVSDDDTVNFEPIWEVDASAPPVNPPDGTDYCVETRDGGDSVLDSQCFDLSFTNHERPTATVTADFFMVSLPSDPSVASVVVTDGGSELGTLSVSDNAPRVTLTSPNGGETLDDTVTVTWNASDEDPGQDVNDLAFSVLYSHDGTTWDPLVLNMTGTTSLDLDLSTVPGSSTARFRVQASDGFHTASDDSDGTVTVADRSPVAAIVAPTEGFRATGTVTLQGSAYDPEDGTLTGSSLVWTSDRDGDLGTGELMEDVTLSGGEHTLTLTATDTQGHTTDVQVRLTMEMVVDGLTVTNDGPTTLGEPTGFTASVTEGTNVRYDWSFGDGGTSSGGPTASHTYTSTGSYTATVTASNSVNSTTASTLVTVASGNHAIYLPLVVR